jgi:hypothetical protein
MQRGEGFSGLNEIGEAEYIRNLHPERYWVPLGSELGGFRWGG